MEKGEPDLEHCDRLSILIPHAWWFCVIFSSVTAGRMKIFGGYSIKYFKVNKVLKR
jgi:hypothetical protein